MKAISTVNAPAAIGPYSQAQHCQGLVWCSGQIALDPATGELVDEDVQAEARQVLRNLAAVLEAAESGLQYVLRATVYLTDLNDFAAVNEVYAEAFGDHRPARACVEVSRLPKGVRVEISCVARSTRA